MALTAVRGRYFRAAAVDIAARRPRHPCSQAAHERRLELRFKERWAEGRHGHGGSVRDLEASPVRGEQCGEFADGCLPAGWRVVPGEVAVVKPGDGALVAGDDG